MPIDTFLSLPVIGILIREENQMKLKSILKCQFEINFHDNETVRVLSPKFPS